MNKKVPKGSPRYKAAQHRTQAAREGRALMPAIEQLEKENKRRTIVGKPPQNLRGGR